MPGTALRARLMCGRLSQYHGIHDFVAALSMPNALINQVGEQPLEHYNIAPTTPLAVLRLQHDHLLAQNLPWGWRPHWARDRAAPINARVEKVAHGAYFRAIWPHRAVVAVDNWFEWVDEGEAKKQPYLIRRRDGQPALCAGIGQFAGDGCGVVILTADALGGLLDIHDRRPVVLAPALARDWLQPDLGTAQAEQLVLALAEPAEAFEWFRVGRAIGNSRNQGANLIEPAP